MERGCRHGLAPEQTAPAPRSPARAYPLACLLLGAALAFPSAFAAPEPSIAPLDALDAAARPFYARAEAEEAAGRYPSAATFYRMVIEHDPAFVPATLGLGRSLEAQHDLGGAERVYRSGPADPDVITALATLVEASRPAEALLLWRQLQGARFGDPAPYLHEVRLTTAENVAAALEAWRTYTTLLQGAEPEGETLLALVDTLTASDPVAAEELLRRSLEEFPSGAANIGVRERLDRIEIEAAAAQIDIGADQPLPASLRPQLVAIERHLVANELDLAAARSRELVARAPSSAAAHGVHADVLLAAERWSEAEIAARIARRLAPDTTEHRVRLGRLLASAYGGRRNTEAVAELRAAARLLPGDAALRFQLAEVEQASGEFDAALASYRVVVGSDPAGTFAGDARQRIATLTRVAPPVAPETLAVTPVSAEGARQWRFAKVFLERGRRDEAIVALDAAIAVEPSNVTFLNLRASLDAEAGDKASAAAGWQASLALAPNQPGLWRNLADLATDEADKRAALAEAARLGDPDAHYLLAEIAATVGDWTTVRAELASFHSQARRDSQYHEAAVALSARATPQNTRVAVVSSVAAVATLAIPALVWFRRRSARTLAQSLAAAPGTWHDAARILSAIRHEVLKHNTTVLPDVADALDAGSLDPWNALAPRLPGLVVLAEGYVDSLVTLARVHGQNLVPARDPLLGALLVILRRLARTRHPEAGALRRDSTVLNGRVYAGLGEIVRKICVLSVDTELVREVYERVASEPGFEGGELPPLDVVGGPIQLRMFKADLHDILANLLRNALSAGTRSLVFEMAEVEDEITGHPLAEIAVVDDAPGTLTNAMIRGRFIGRGLGLAVDLVNRHGGAIRVETRPGEQKAVVVQFRAVETGEVDANPDG